MCGVKVEEFSIGFGKEIIAFNDKKNTRWKICLLPLGGYVRMFGDKNAASITDQNALSSMSEEEKKQSFIAKNVYQRFSIVVAGPIANFLLAIVFFTIIFSINGVNISNNQIAEVVENSAAYSAGVKNNDKIIKIDEVAVADFNQIQQIISASADKKLRLEILRDEKIINLEITPQTKIVKNIFSEDMKIGMIGVVASSGTHQELNIFQSFSFASIETYKISLAVLKALSELITGKRSFEELGGPIKIAKYSAKSVELGFTAVIWFVAMISINLGVMNLLPIPVLDGGHLFYYLIEMITKKPLSQKIQNIGFQIGFSLLITLMIFTTLNDIKQIFFN
jgi:regulator of sigma E protease